MATVKADLLIRGIGSLATPEGRRAAPGPLADRVREIPHAAVIVSGGRIVEVIAERRLPGTLAPTREIDAEGRLATPGLVDCHTHLVFAGSRAREFEARLRGASYVEIARRGGGILSTVKAVRAAAAAALLAEARGRLARMLREGVCAVEVKSGYGLDTATELRLLRLIRRLGAEGPQRLSATFLGAHAVPPEFQRDRGGYIEAVVREMLPRVAGERLADACDVFCEEGAFDREESRRILMAARDLGLRLRIHAEQFTQSGGARLAAELGALSADHLTEATEEDAQALAAAGVVAVVLPGSALMTGAPPFDYARRLLAGGAAVAVATDCNPGTSYLDSMPLAMALACALYRMTPAQALAAATLNAAAALGAADETGTIEPGKRADLVLWDAEDFREIPYRFGRVPVREVFCAGRPVLSYGTAAPPSSGGAGKTLRIWIDGAARGNPGPASAGVVIEDETGRVLLDEGFALGEATNNVAEYAALIHALEHAARLGGRVLRVHSDSELLVKQMTGRYKVRHANLQPLHAKAKEGLARFDAVEIVHVHRERNRRADAAANRALDKT